MASKGTKLSLESRKKISEHHADVSGDKNGRWNAGKFFNGAGYLYRYVPNHPNRTKQGYVLEHRLVVENKLGRYLKPGEIVHHINGIVDDNRIENLEVLSNSDHTRKHMIGNTFTRGKSKCFNYSKIIKKLYDSGWGFRSISRQFAKDGINISYMTIDRFINREFK